MGNRINQHWIQLPNSTNTKSLRRSETSSHTTITKCGQRFIVLSRVILRAQQRVNQSIGYFYTYQHTAQLHPSNSNNINGCVKSSNPTNSCGGSIHHGHCHIQHCNLSAQAEGIELPPAQQGGTETQCSSAQLGQGRKTTSPILRFKIRQFKYGIIGHGLP